MSLDEWRLVFIAVCLILISAASAPLIMAYLPKRSEPFFEMAVLGEEGKAEKYYPDEDPNLGVGKKVDWAIFLRNRMGEVKYVSVRVKILNSTMAPPNTTTCEGSPAPILYEVNRILLKNETWHHPLHWSLLNATQEGNMTMIRSLVINGDPQHTNVAGKNENSFRIIIELWTYDDKLEQFVFGWFSNEGRRCAWNQIWFNAI